ncbi:hypothetical protein AYO40_01705 [Planctomycetaceae bacterium SCGC AG-212-D15]|nr:hypothetical protein AYO40_01705 [Planctomycetaceae bacterium SCGC AG-212-D15]
MKAAAKAGLDAIDDANHRRRGLDVVVMSDPRYYDNPYSPALQMEAEIIRDYIPVNGAEDLVTRLALLVVQTGRLIRTLYYYGHGNSDHFMIGEDVIDMHHGHLLVTLRRLRPLFAPDASVILMSCDVGQDQKLLSWLSAAWGGVRVVAWTGRIIVNRTDESVTPNGDRVVCLRNACSVN